MPLPNAKELVKLANACRKAGISTFRGDGIEFTLTQAIPVAKASKKSIQEALQAANEPVESDEIGYDALLNWSVIPHDEGNQ